MSVLTPEGEHFPATVFFPLKESLGLGVWLAVVSSLGLAGSLTFRMWYP